VRYFVFPHDKLTSDCAS